MLSPVNDGGLGMDRGIGLLPVVHAGSVLVGSRVGRQADGEARRVDHRIGGASV
jgi:hypothetical protein